MESQTGHAHLSQPERSRLSDLYTVVKHFLFERTGVGTLQINPGHDKRVYDDCETVQKDLDSLIKWSTGASWNW